MRAVVGEFKGQDEVFSVEGFCVKDGPVMLAGEHEPRRLDCLVAYFSGWTGEAGCCAAEDIVDGFIERVVAAVDEELCSVFRKKLLAIAVG